MKWFHYLISAIIALMCGSIGHAAPPAVVGGGPAVVTASIDGEGVVRIPIECEDMKGVIWGPQGFTPQWTAGLWGRDLYQNMVFGAVFASRMAAAVCDASETPSAALQDIEVPRDGKYKVWVKYECPPFFNYPFGIRIEKLNAAGKPEGKAYDKVYGLRGALRHFSFNRLQTDDLYWGWGMDHDAAEGYETDLAAGRYRVTLYKAALPAGFRGPRDAGGLPVVERVGARSVDAILITSLISEMSGPTYPKPEDTYAINHTWPLYRAELNNFPLLPELQRTNTVYARFRNTGAQPIVVSYDHWNHRPAHIFYMMTYWSMPLVRFYDAAGKLIMNDNGTPLTDNGGQWRKPIGPGEVSPWIGIGPTMNPENSSPFVASAVLAPGANPPAELTFTMDLALQPTEKAIVKSFTRMPTEPELTVLIQPDLHRPQGREATLKFIDVFREMTRQLDAYPRVGPLPKKLRLWGHITAAYNGAMSPQRPDFGVCLDYALALGLNTWPYEWNNAAATDAARAYYANKGASITELSGYNQHTENPADVRARITRPDPANPKGEPVIDTGAQSRFYYNSFGDEILPPSLDAKNEKTVADFRDFLRARGVKPDELGAQSYDAIKPISDAEFTASTKTGLSEGEAGRNLKRLFWWSHEFAIEQGVNKFATLTQEMTRIVGPHFKTTANLGGMHPFYWMNQSSFIEQFKGGGMTLAWSEDYDYMMPEASRLVIDFQAAYLRAGAKYHDTPMMFFTMPHFPGNTGQHLIQNAVTLWGQGIKDLDFFFVSPDAFATENYISFRGGMAETGRGIRQISGMAGNIEDQLLPARTRPAKVAILLSEASDVWEIEGQQNQWGVAPGTKATNVSQEERKSIWHCLRNAGYQVDLLTESDVAEGWLKDYRVLYVCGRNLDRKAVRPLQDWVNAGGSLYLTAGAARKDQYDEPLKDLDALVGRDKVEKATLYRGALRAKLELLQLEPLDTVQISGGEQTKLPAIEALATLEVFTPTAEAIVLGKFTRAGMPAFVGTTIGKGRGYYIGTLPGQAYVRKGLLPARPMGKGGPEWYFSQTEPVDYDRQAAGVILRPPQDLQLPPDCAANHRGVVANILVNAQATIVTVVNLAKSVDGKANDVRITVSGVRPARKVSTACRKPVKVNNGNGVVTVTLTELDEADVIVIEH